MADPEASKFQQQFISGIAEEFSLRRVPTDSELASPKFTLSGWIAQNGGAEAQIFAKLARRFRLPYLPSAAIPPEPLADLVRILPLDLGLGARTAQPWLLIDCLGARPVLAHYAPACDDLQGFPPSVCHRVMISPKDYDTIWTGSPPQKQTPGTRAEISDKEYVAAAQSAAPETYVLEDGQRIPCAEVIAEIERLGMSFVPLSHLGRLSASDLESIGSVTDQTMAQHDAVCYAALQNHYFGLAPTLVEGPLQDTLRQLDSSEGERRWVTLAWAPKSFIFSRRLGLGDGGEGGAGQSFAARLQKGELLITPLSMAEFEAEQTALTDPVAALQWMLYRAVQDNASDIHIEQDGGQARVRFRVDGDLYELTRLPLATLSVLTNLIKTACRLPLGTKHRILDGRFTIRLPARNSHLECRVSIIPQPEHDATVIRISQRSITRFTAESLSFGPSHNKILGAAMRQNRGMIVITGPTGCGKSTTLYTLLSSARSPKTNIITIENPIEVALDGIRQFATAEDQGFTFAEIFRGVLRQDPDKVMVGEMRDNDSADIAVRAALTGHLVLTTLHTNDALGVIPRMLSMGIDPAQLADALLLIQAQRLAPRLCSHCYEEYQPTKRELDALAAAQMPAPEGLLVRRASAAGCDRCHHRGTQGQQVIMEVFPVTQALSSLIRRQASYVELTDYTRERHWRTLYRDALDYYVRGVISFEEAVSHTADFDPDGEG